jgi:hypothetical protein
LCRLKSKPERKRTPLPVNEQQAQLPLPLGTGQAEGAAAISAADEDALEGQDPMDGDDLGFLLEGFSEEWREEAGEVEESEW